MRYGLPYVSSKNRIAKQIVELLPRAETFYDLFAGGCAVTHAAMLSKKYQHYVINDINGKIVKLFVDAIAGNIPNLYRVVDRETFFATREFDIITALCYSFGNNQLDYLYTKDDEKIKLVASNMILAESISERLAYYKQFCALLKNNIQRDNIERLINVERLYNIDCLKNVEDLHNIDCLTTDYQSVVIKTNSVVYADPPYRNLKEQSSANRCFGKFDFNRFDNWCREVDFPVYISEYEMPSDFVSLTGLYRKSTLNGKGTGEKTSEQIFIHRKWQNIIGNFYEEQTLF